MICMLLLLVNVALAAYVVRLIRKRSAVTVTLIKLTGAVETGNPELVKAAMVRARPYLRSEGWAL